MIAAKLSLLLATAAIAHGAELTGYLMDNLCINLCRGTTGPTPCTPDLTNAFYTPEDHTGWCLLLGGCVNSKYALMSETPDGDGKHTAVLNMTGDAAHAAVVEYIKATTIDTKAQFPLVKIFYDESDLATSDDGTTPVLLNATIADPWPLDAPKYSGAATTYKICVKGSDADIDANNMCFRSDVAVSKFDAKNMIVVQSSGCPDHENMSGGSGKVPNSQTMPDNGDSTSTGVNT